MGGQETEVGKAFSSWCLCPLKTFFQQGYPTYTPLQTARPTGDQCLGTKYLMPETVEDISHSNNPRSISLSLLGVKNCCVRPPRRCVAKSNQTVRRWGPRLLSLLLLSLRIASRCSLSFSVEINIGWCSNPSYFYSSQQHRKEAERHGDVC